MSAVVSLPITLAGHRRVESLQDLVQDKAKLRDKQAILEGARLFAPTCGTGYCHGVGGSGGGAPKLRGRGLEPDYIFKTVSNGVPGTAMIPFKGQYTEEQIWKITAYLLSDETGPPPGSAGGDSKTAKPSDPRGESKKEEVRDKPTNTLAGDAKSGRSSFFDSGVPYNCAVCHKLGGEGGSIGPDLAGSAARSPRELLASIVMPGKARDPKYQTVTVTLKNGDKVTGIKKEEDADSIRIYDAVELPPVLRTVQKSDVAKTEQLEQPVMPADYGSRYTLKQLLDLIAFIKTADREFKGPVSLKDIF